ncbi:Uncharacterised protein [Mycobacteroides abscessus subsp. abscessus]|nr:Uncharacterised protein [Mycobacteroides abscessus subsp. abscessus]
MALPELLAGEVGEHCCAVVADCVVGTAGVVLEHGRRRVTADTCVRTREMGEQHGRVEPESVLAAGQVGQ